MKDVNFLSSHSQLENFNTQNQERFDRLIMIQAVRVVFLIFLLAMIVGYQSIQSDFLNPNVWVPVYSFIAVSFFLNSIFLVYFEAISKYWVSSAVVFSYDAVLYTSLIFYTGANHSVFLFLYLVNIILCGLVYKRKGAVTLSLWTSILFSFLLMIDQNNEGQNLFFAIILNNISFFTVAFLSGKLSELVAFMGSELEARGKEIDVLQDFNKLIVENIGTGLLTINKEFEVTYFNHGATKICDLNFELGKHIDLFFSDISSQIISVENKYQKIELIIQDTIKGHQILEFTASSVDEISKEYSGYILLFEDKTELKRLENEIRQQEKMAAVGQLAAGIAHEIRNPLASISGSIQLVMDDVKDQSGNNQKLFNIMIKEIDRLDNLITEFLDFVRPDFLANDVIYLNDLLEESVKIIKLNQNIRTDIMCTLNLNSKQVIMGNLNKLKQAIINIIINAYQAMEKVDIPKLTISTSDENEKIKVIVCDNGVGMDEKNIKRVFEPFHTTKTKGTGLGMAVTHKIIEAHEAKIFIESELNKGTTIIIEFGGAVLKGEEHKQRKTA